MSATKMPPHVSIVFKELFDEVKSTKRQQWIMTNYCVLILAAIYALQLPYQSLPVITAILIARATSGDKTLTHHDG